MDLISSYCVSLREKCKVSFVVLQQENRNSADMDRRKAGLTECSSEDLKDTGNTFNDCELCIGVYFPLKFKIKSHLGYPIIVDESPLTGNFKGLRDRYKALNIIKNRQGISDRVIPVNFFGELGIFKEFPPAKTISDFSVYTSLNPPSQIKIDLTPDSGETKEITYSF